MGRKTRGVVMDPRKVQIFHLIKQCNRAAFLCGTDPYSGICYDHRRQWIRERLQILESIFGIDCLTYTIMSKQLHLVLRSRPDVVEGWSDEQVARRWLRLFPSRRNNDRPAAGPSPPELHAITGDSAILADRRQRLSDLSWWMRCTAQHIACMSNREEGVTGPFFGSRSKSRLLLNEDSLSACPAELDLKPIRAAFAENLETSRTVRIQDRIDGQRASNDRWGPSGHDSRDHDSRDHDNGDQLGEMRIIKLGKSNWR